MPGETPNFATMTPDEFAAWQQSRLNPAPSVAVEDSTQVWANKRRRGGITTLPSGQTCRLKRLDPQDLLVMGILDKVTRLEGLANSLVQTAEGAPPEKDKLPTREDFDLLLDVINKVVIAAVVEPAVQFDPVPDPETGVTPDFEEGKIYVSDVDLEDRLFILNESMKGVKALDNFRNPK